MYANSVTKTATKKRKEKKRKEKKRKQNKTKDCESLGMIPLKARGYQAHVEEVCVCVYFTPAKRL